jgi:lysophospholipase L1-like esterase
METIGAVLDNADIWMLGDSRIGRWNQEFLTGDMKFANLGIDGQTSSQVYYRFKNYLEIDTPELVIVEVGINELKVIGLDKNLAKSITYNYYGNIEAMISLCDENGIKMLLINVFPVGKIELLRRFVWNRYVNETIREANERLKSYCDNNHVFYFDAYALLADNGETVNPEYQADFLHINRKGYEVLSRELIKQIHKITGKE